MENKMTIKDYFNELNTMTEGMVFSDGSTVEDFIAGRIKVATKKSGSKASTKPENIALRERVLEVLTSADAPMRASDFGKFEGLSPIDGISTAKVTSLLTSLKNEGKVLAEKDKKSTIYSIA